MVSTSIYCLGCPFMWQNVDFLRKTLKITRFPRLLLGAQPFLFEPSGRSLRGWEKRPRKPGSAWNRSNSGHLGVLIRSHVFLYYNSWFPKQWTKWLSAVYIRLYTYFVMRSRALSTKYVYTNIHTGVPTIDFCKNTTNYNVHVYFLFVFGGSGSAGNGECLSEG